MTKDIAQMSVEELKTEIQKYPCKKDERYVFVSYSHRDAALVYPQVLDWLRRGYNIYIDVDFENHGSEVNWVEIMEKCIRRKACSMVTCFRSENYLCSYAALIELLTIRSPKTMARRRNVGAVDKVPIDVIEMGGGTFLPDFFDNAEIKTKYKENFIELKKRMGTEFSQNNPAEGARLKEGLVNWIKTCNNPVITEQSGEERYETIKEEYADNENYCEFYSAIAQCALDWFSSTELNGNTKDLFSDGVLNRFQELGIATRTGSAASFVNAASLDDNQNITVSIQPAPSETEEKADEQPAGQNGETYYYRHAVLTGVDGNYLLKAGSIVSLTPSKSCAENVKRLLHDSIDNGLIDRNTGTLLKDIPFRKLSPAACMVSGNSTAGSVWQTANADKPAEVKPPAEKKEEPAGRLPKEKPVSGNLADLFERSKISEGTQVYIEGYPDSIAAITEDGRFLYKGNERTMNEYIALAGRMQLGRKEPLSVIIDKKSSKSLQDLLRDEAVPEEQQEETGGQLSDISNNNREEAREKKTDVKTAFIPEEVTPVEKNSFGNLTIGEVRKRLTNDHDFLFKLRDIRQSSLPFGAKSYMDYAMATILNGCNNVKEDYQLNYYRFAIANYENKKEAAKTEATWTWSSNARKVVGYVSAGILPVQINNYFTGLPETTTINDLIMKFESCEEEPFITKKNNLVILCLQKFIEGYYE